MLSVDDIVRVVVRVHRETVSKNAFDTALMIVEDSEMDGISDVKTAANLTGALTILAGHGFNGESVQAELVTKYFGVDPAPARLKMIFYGGESTAVQALEAAVTADSGFYGVFLGQAETDTVVKGLVAAIEAADRALVFFVSVVNAGEADAATETASGSLLQELYATAYQRTMVADFSAFSDVGALAGLAMGLQLAHEDRAFALCYKTLAGVAAVALNQDGVDAVKELNGNVYIQRGNHYKVFENGSMMNGQRYDEVLYVDMISKDLQEAALGLLADNPDRMPQTDDASAQFINRMSGVLMSYRNMGVLAPAVWRGSDIGRIRNGDMIENGFALWAESYDLQSDEDRAAHKAMPIHAALTLAGSLESVVISVDVQG